MIWNEDDIKILKECAENGVPWSQCAKMLKRKLPTVRAKAYNMGFVKYKYKKRSGSKNEILDPNCQEQIQKCLNCQKPECDNCLNYKKQ